MREVLTTSMARNIFYGGSLFFIVIFIGLSVHSHRYIVTTSTVDAELTDSVALGKRVWEHHACINCDPECHYFRISPPFTRLWV